MLLPSSSEPHACRKCLPKQNMDVFFPTPAESTYTQEQVKIIGGHRIVSRQRKTYANVCDFKLEIWNLF